MEDNRWCVYVHTSPSGKKYVGVTSQYPNARWRNGKGYKSSPAFNNAIQKYGWDNISHEIIAEGLSEGKAKELEIKTIKQLNSTNRDFGYNISSGGDGTVGISYYGSANPFYGHHHSDETRDSLSRYRTKYYKTHQHPRCRVILQFDMNGNYVREFSSAREAEKVLGIDHSVIAKVCKGKLNYAHGYMWAYKDSVIDVNNYKSVCKEKALQKHRNVGQGQSKAVLVFNIDGSFLCKYRSAADAANAIGVHKDTVSSSCRNNSVVQKKYRCCYEEVV